TNRKPAAGRSTPSGRQHHNGACTMDRVATYYRMSKDTQDKSIDRQRSEVLPHCQRKGYSIVSEEQDEGISGSEVAKRPGLQKTLALAKAKRIDGVVMDDLDRLARLDMIDFFEHIVGPLRRAGV